MRIELFYKDEKTLVIYTPGPPTNTTLDNERYIAISIYGNIEWVGDSCTKAPS